MTTVFDRIGASAPVNRQAALAACGKGTAEHAAVSQVNGTLHWTAPPKTRPVPAIMPDLTGRRYGRLLVVGLLAGTEGGKARWVLRCDCGDYEPRSSKTVTAADPGDMCGLCREKANLHHQARCIQYGEKVALGIREEERNRLLEVDAARKAAFTTRPALRMPAQATPTFRSAVPGQAPAAKRPGPSKVAFVVHDAMKAAIKELVATGIKGIDLANRLQERYPLGRELAAHLLRGLVDDGEVVEIEIFVPDGLRLYGAYVGSFYLPAGGRVAPAGSRGPIGPGGRTN